jgi:hypothetical protein
MTKIKYSEEQIRELKANINVKNCTWKHIVFTKEFKEKVVKLSINHIFPRDVFEQFWFPNYVLDSVIPSNSIMRWKRNMKLKWVIEENKGQKKKEYIDISKMNKDEYIQYLEAKLAIVEELKKLNWWNYP